MRFLALASTTVKHECPSSIAGLSGLEVVEPAAIFPASPAHPRLRPAWTPRSAAELSGPPQPALTIASRSPLRLCIRGTKKQHARPRRSCSNDGPVAHHTAVLDQYIAKVAAGLPTRDAMDDLKCAKSLSNAMRLPRFHQLSHNQVDKSEHGARCEPRSSTTIPTCPHLCLWITCAKVRRQVLYEAWPCACKSRDLGVG